MSQTPDLPSPALRASDAEREAVIARLTDATAQGRLTLAEFSDRAGRAYAATTRAELQPLLADLPSGAAPGTAVVGATIGIVAPAGPAPDPRCRRSRWGRSSGAGAGTWTRSPVCR
jgi:hypothetical protein